MLKRILCLFALCFSVSACAYQGVNPEKLINDGFKLGNWMVVDYDNGIAPICGLYFNTFRKWDGSGLYLVSGRNGAKIHKISLASVEFTTLERDIESLKLFGAWVGIKDLRTCKRWH